MPSFTLKLCALALYSSTTLWITSSATAQDFSAKPITLVVGFAAGGSNNIVGRLIAPHLRKPEVMAQLEKVALPSGLMASSEEFHNFVSAKYIRWGAVLKPAKIEFTD